MTLEFGAPIEGSDARADRMAQPDKKGGEKEWGLLKRILLSTELEYASGNEHRATKHQPDGERTLPHLGSFTDFGTLGTSPPGGDATPVPDSGNGSPSAGSPSKADKAFMTGLGESPYSGASIIPFLYDRMSPPKGGDSISKMDDPHRGNVHHKEWDPNTNQNLKLKGASRFDRPDGGKENGKGIWEMIDNASRPINK